MQFAYFSRLANELQICIYIDDYKQENATKITKHEGERAHARLHLKIRFFLYIVILEFVFILYI